MKLQYMQCFKSKHIFITGGTGFFGKSILSCIREGFLPKTRFSVLSRNPQKFLRENPGFVGLENVEYVSGDVRDFRCDAAVDFVLHAATPAVTDISDDEMSSIILDGTAHVLDYAKRYGAAKIMMTSSGAVYGPVPNVTHISEDMPCNPITAYGIAKLKAEQMCAASGLHALLPRCFAFVGPYLNLDIHYAIGNFIRNGLNGEDIVVKGNGRPYRSYLYADDLVHWLFTILAHGEHARPYNVGSDDGHSIAEIAQLVATHFTPTPQVRILDKTSPTSPPLHYVPDISRAKRELGLSVGNSLEDAIGQTIAKIHDKTSLGMVHKPSQC